MNIQQIIDCLNLNYRIPPHINCGLMRAYTNDVFLINTPEKRYVMKAYNPRRSQQEIMYEVELINHLAHKGLKVPNTIKGKDEHYVYQLDTPNRKQNVVLFEYAEGKKPTPPFSVELYYKFGASIARMHELSSDFKTNFQRRILDLEFLLDEPVSVTLPLLDHKEDQVFLSELSKQITFKINESKIVGLDWGPIHGDATLDNLHVTDNGEIILYDFDSGGPGWRASDLQGWAKNNKTFEEKWKMFRRGYASIRNLKAIDLVVAPYLYVAWEIWGIQLDLELRISKQGRDKTVDYLQEQLNNLRKYKDNLLT